MHSMAVLSGAHFPTEIASQLKPSVRGIILSVLKEIKFNNDYIPTLLVHGEYTEIPRCPEGSVAILLHYGSDGLYMCNLLMAGTREFENANAFVRDIFLLESGSNTRIDVFLVAPLAATPEFKRWAREDLTSIIARQGLRYDNKHMNVQAWDRPNAYSPAVLHRSPNGQVATRRGPQVREATLPARV
ncbi:hypothetical protein BJ085DRAFT_31083 [Dimargaris cristalligena]|uniref:Uncharacterized protein n=1 Tax=Dimargaris cristalligena TaxID=215637 RepID=A0A4P9ZSF0_9FUNG|nr:hypothetical protein BJ085DRAFT_31083 [Dimargaris cristalligena]|eukprot:RKP35390.1 hypothetical protein BJ085DRAFT_31083 [Dimargaris cristalligena]